jgi:hypothetical protein
MATSPDKGFLEQLREMRNTRMQQLRQGGQQAGLLTKQIAAMNTLNKTMESVLRAQSSSNATLKNLNTSQVNVSRQTEQMSKSINNLSSSITRSMSSMASAVGKGASGAVGAVGSAGGSVVGAASSVASGVASAVAKVLPFAIAGVVGKMMLWDKMDDSVKRDLTDSFGGLVESLFGGIDTSGLKKVTAPITKEFGIVFGALGDTLETVTNKISELVNILSKTIGGLAGINVPGGASESLNKAKQNAKVIGTTGEKIRGDVAGAVDYVGKIDSSDLGTAALVGGGTLAAIGAGAFATGKIKSPSASTPPQQTQTQTPTQQSKMKAAEKPRNLNPKEIARMQQAMQSLNKKGIGKPSLLQLIDELSMSRVYGMGKEKLKMFGEFAAKYKLSTAGNVIQILFAMGLGYLVYTEVDSLYENGIIDDKERSDILEYLTKKQAIISGGGIIGGTLSGIGAGLVGTAVSTVTGGVAIPGAVLGTIASVAVGSYGGSKLGEIVADKVLTAPSALTKNYTPLEFAGKNLVDPIGSVDGRRTNDDPRRTDKKPQGAMTPPSASSSRDAFDMFKGAIGQAESRGNYGARNQSGSSASGKYQVIRSTFELYAKDKNSPVYRMTFEDFQKSPELQEALMDYMLQDYKRVLSAGGVPIDEKTLYLAHFLGPDTAVKVYNSNPNDSLSKYITKNGHYDLMIKQNPGLITQGTTTGAIQLAIGKRVSSQMAGNIPTARSNPIAQASMTNMSASFNENLARRRQEAKEAEKYEEGSDSFVGPQAQASKSKKPLSDFANQFSFKSFADGFNEKTNELKNVISSMTTVQDIETTKNEMAKEQAKSQQGINIIDQSQNTNVASSSGSSSGGISVTPVTSDHSSNRNHQFHALAGGGYRA